MNIASSGLGLKIWNSETLELVKEYPITGRTKQPAQINAFHVRADNTQLASVVDFDYIKLIDLEQKSVIELSDTSEVRCCSYDSSGRYLATGTSKGFMEWIDFRATTGYKKRNIKIPTSTCVNCICYSKNDRFLATGNSNGTISLYNNNTNTFNKPFMYQNHAKMSCPPNVTSIHYSTSNIGHLGASYEDGSVIMWDVSKEQPQCVFKEHSSICTSIVSSPLNAILMVSGGMDNLLNMYDTSAKKYIKSLNCPGGITSLDILKNGSTIGVGTSNGYLLIYDLRNTENGPLRSVKAHESSVYCVKFIQSIGSRDKPLSVINNNLQPPSSDHVNSMRRSNSYNNEIITPQIKYNIYSPEPAHNYNHTHINSNESNSSQTIVFQNNQVNQLNSGESFILHKKNTPSSNSNSSSNQTTSNSPIMPGNNEITINMSNVNSRSKIDLKPSHIKQSKLPAEYLSPIGPNNPQSAMVSNGVILSSTAQTNTLNGNYLDMSKMSFNQTNSSKIQIDDSGRSISKNTPKSVKSPPPSVRRNGHDHSDIAENSQLITMPVEQLKSLLKETVKEALREYDQRLNLNSETTNGVHSSTALAMPNDQIKNFIKETVEDCHDDLMSENFKFKIEIFKEFTQLEEKLTKKIESSSLNTDLLEEIMRLKEEIKRLKSQF